VYNRVTCHIVAIALTLPTATVNTRPSSRYHVPLIRSQNYGAIPVEMCIDWLLIVNCDMLTVGCNANVKSVSKYVYVISTI